MSGHRTWRDIREPRTPEQEARIAAGAAALERGLRLGAVPSGRGLTQTETAQRLGASQSHVAQVEARDDVYVSSLFSYVRALGGDLRIEAVFPGQEPGTIIVNPESDEREIETTGASA